MKVTRYVCSGCGKEVNRVVEDERNLLEYRELLKPKSCRDCKNSPEQRLLRAAFGELCDE